MNRSQRWSLFFLLGLVVTGNASAVAQTTVAGFADTSLTVTIHVYNYAKVDHRTLMEAQKVATGIFRKTGVQTRWIDASDNKQQDWTHQRSSDLTHIVLSLPRAMGDRFQLSNEVMGLAPGMGRDRNLVYVFYSRVVEVADIHFRALLERMMSRCASASPPQILGHAISHEIGHLLLNMDVHSQSGIMRGDWDLNDLQGVAHGFLIFTPQQAEVIRAEVVRRVGQLQTVEVAGLKSPTPAR